MTLFIKFADGTEDVMRDLTRAQAFQITNGFGANVIGWRLVGLNGHTLDERGSI